MNTRLRNHPVIRPALGLLAAISILATPSQAQTGKWSVVAQTSKPIGREECSLGQAGGKFYLIGGRGVSPVQEYNPATKAWRNLSNTPVELNHFQALSVSGLIYVICAFNGAYPHEVPVPNMYIFDPLSDTWVKGMAIPTARLRGSAGVAVYQDKIYVALGIKDGHSSGWAPMLDEYNPATGEWKALADAPRGRDHFQTAIVGGKLYAVGGRRSNWMVNAKLDIFSELEQVDVYDIAAGTWSTLPTASNMPEPRSGTVDIAMGNDIVVAGGGNDSALAHKETHAFNTLTNTWRPLAKLNTGRQVLGGVLNNGGIYVASGSGGKGGTPVLQDMEVFFMADSLPATGEALTAGTLASDETPFNLGLVASGQKFSRSIALKHASGNQGVLIGSVQVTGDASFKVKSSPAFPALVRPGSSVPVEIEFTSTGAVPGAASLDVTLAIPKGVVVKIPLEANKAPIAIRASDKRAELRKPAARKIDGGWMFLSPDEKAGAVGASDPATYRDGNGRQRQQAR